MGGHGRRLIVLCLALLANTAGATGERPGTDEVRVVIDVSGSMRQNDPHNLRAPALRLLVNLLPPDSRAGAWSFAQYVNPLVPVGETGAEWRQQALTAADGIHSRGLFTDIGAALKSATRDWREPDPATRRSLILLTDGVVDISKDAAANAKSRRAILDEMLPTLRAAGVKVHTIALSANADAELLKTLATATDGGFEQTDTAEQLKRVFLRMFERAVDRDSLPMSDNLFQVDSTIEEVTLLVFHQAAAEPTRVQPPGTTAFDARSAPTNVRWHAEAGYDLITIQRPAAGEWQLLAAADPDNRALIVTDLKLQLSDIPNNLLEGERLPLQLALIENGEIITRPDFLRLLDVRVRQQAAAAAPREWVLADNGLADDSTADDGIYSVRLSNTLTPGEHEIVVSVAARTFQREKRQIVRVAGTPLAVEVDPVPAADGQRRIRLLPAVDWIRPESLRIGASVLQANGSTIQLDVPRQPDGNWLATLPVLDPSQDYQVDLEVAGQTSTDRAFQLDLPRIQLAAEVIAAQPAPDAPASPPAAIPSTEPERPVNWLLVGTILVTANLAVFGLIGLAIYLLRLRRRAPSIGDKLAGGPAEDSATTKDEPS